MVRFKAQQAPILNTSDRSKRGDRVVQGMKRLIVKAINTDGVVCAAVLVKKSVLSWTSFGFYKESSLQSSVRVLPNLPFHSYDSRDRASIAYACACTCSDLITSKVKKKMCKREGQQIHVHPSGNKPGPLVTKDEATLEAYLLDSSHKGNNCFQLPIQSSRLDIMLPHSLVKVGHGSTTISEYMHELIGLVRERALDLVKTQYAEKVGVLVAFQGNDLRLCWRLCSYATDGVEILFGPLCGEYIDAANSMTVTNPRLYRLLPVVQALKGGHIASVKESTMASGTSSMSCAASVSSGFMRPLNECASKSSNIEKPKGVLAVLTSLLTRSMLKVLNSAKLTKEWEDFRKYRVQKKENVDGEVEMTCCSLAQNNHGGRIDGRFSNAPVQREYTPVEDTGVCVSLITTTTTVGTRNNADQKSKKRKKCHQR